MNYYGQPIPPYQQMPPHMQQQQQQTATIAIQP